MLILITDDEAPARRELRFMLAELWPEAVLLEAGDGEEALEIIGNRPVDVAFLDINMPEMDGLEVAAALLDFPDPPALIFATAYNEHALRAFELAAFDYIVKPIDERRLANTLKRLQQQLSQRQPQLDPNLLQILLEQMKPQHSLNKLWGERDAEVRRLVDFDDIYWLEAREKRVVIGTDGEELRSQLTLKALMERLPTPPFVQVHRSYIVNMEKIAEVEPWFSGGYLLKMSDGERSEVPMSRRFAAQFKKMTGW